MSAGGAVGAVLGGRGAEEALNWELLVFLKENIGFLKAGELPGGAGREGWAPLGALLGASARSPGAVGRLLVSRRSVGGAPGEVFGPLGRSFRRSGDNFG